MIVIVIRCFGLFRNVSCFLEYENSWNSLLHVTDVRSLTTKNPPHWRRFPSTSQPFLLPDATVGNVLKRGRTADSSDWGWREASCKYFVTQTSATNRTALFLREALAPCWKFDTLIDFYMNMFYKNIEAKICEKLRINPRLRLWKENFVCWKIVNKIKFFLSLNGKTRQKATKTALAHFWKTLWTWHQAIMPAAWLKNYFNTIKTPKTVADPAEWPGGPAVTRYFE